MSKMEPQNPAGTAFANYQFEIYREPAGNISAVPFTFAELEQQAREKLTPGAFGYVAGGAGIGGNNASQPRGVQPTADCAPHAA